jgi:hypothetical protein
MTLFFEGLFRLHIACMAQSANPVGRVCCLSIKLAANLAKKEKSPRMKWAAIHPRRSGTGR